MNKHRLSQIKTILINVSRETIKVPPEDMGLFSDEDCNEILTNLEQYERILCQWQRHINLIANASVADIWQRHIIDSMQLFPVALRCMPAAENWLDVGSGGGFPSLVLAILFKNRGRGHVTMIESNGKKSSFLRRVAADLNLPAHVINQRIEASYGKAAFFPERKSLFLDKKGNGNPVSERLSETSVDKSILEKSPRSKMPFLGKDCDRNNKTKKLTGATGIKTLPGHFPQEWKSVLRKKMRKDKQEARESDSIIATDALVLPPDIITARAVADLPILLTLIAPFYGPQTIALLQKGRGFLQEIEQARLNWLFDVEQYPSLTDQGAAILVIRNLRSIQE